MKLTDILRENTDWILLCHLFQFNWNVDSEELIKGQETTTNTDWVKVNY